MTQDLTPFLNSSRNRGKTRDLGPCVRTGCEGRRKYHGSEYCRPCRERKRKREAMRAARARARDKRIEERALDEMVLKPLPRTRHDAYTESARAVASNERAFQIPADVGGFWYKWLANPDNPCTPEALDDAGW